MSDKEKLDYMLSIYRQANLYFDTGRWGEAEAYLNNFESKIAIGWPDPRLAFL